MRREIVVLGCFIIILIMIAGCTSSQNATSTGTKSQNSGPAASNVETYAWEEQPQPTECIPPTGTPERLKKFYPVISGWDSKEGMYKPNDGSFLSLSIRDLGPCALGSVDEFFNKFYPVGTYKQGVNTQIRSKINNFHGYPALRQITYSNISKGLNETKYETKYDSVIIGINNHRYVLIDSYGLNTIDLESEIDTLAKAIDFKGLAAAV